jgi:hypothetical protein
MIFLAPVISFLLQGVQSAIVKYNLEITQEYVTVTSADGIDISRAGSLVNITFPGPLIEAQEGDQLVITVTNHQDGNEASIHWHGQLQAGTPYYDGVVGVSECGISSGSTAIYNFTAYPAGTYWYHSHAGAQYADGQFGPLIVHPNADTWEKEVEEEFVVLFHEWNVTPAFVELAQLKAGMQLGGMYSSSTSMNDTSQMNNMDGMSSSSEMQTDDMANMVMEADNSSSTSMNDDTSQLNNMDDMSSSSEMQTDDMANMVMEADIPWPYWLVLFNFFRSITAVSRKASADECSVKKTLALYSLIAW